MSQTARVEMTKRDLFLFLYRDGEFMGKMKGGKDNLAHLKMMWEGCCTMASLLAEANTLKVELRS